MDRKRFLKRLEGWKKDWDRWKKIGRLDWKKNWKRDGWSKDWKKDGWIKDWKRRGGKNFGRMDGKEVEGRGKNMGWIETRQVVDKCTYMWCSRLTY